MPTMHSLRTAFHRPPCISRTFYRPRVRLRWQHDSHGPHKEYFQHPSQYPQSFQPSPVQPIGPNPRPSQLPQSAFSQTSSGRKPSFTLRFINATLLAVTCFITGWMAGRGVITWEYFQPPYERGSAEFEELQAEIEDLLEGAQLCEMLRSQGWKEEPIIKPSVSNVDASGGDHQLVADTLSGNQGVTMKMFTHPAHPVSYAIFFTGFGLEGSPDKVHPGLVTTVLTEAWTRHMDRIAKLHGLHHVDRGASYTASTVFLEPGLRPGEIYGAFVQTDQWAIALPDPGAEQMHRPKLEAETRPTIAAQTSISLLTTDYETNLVSQKSFDGVEADALDAGGNRLLAIATFTGTFDSENVVRAENESNEHYFKRIEEEAARIERVSWPERPNNTELGPRGSKGWPPPGWPGSH